MFPQIKKLLYGRKNSHSHEMSVRKDQKVSLQIPPPFRKFWTFSRGGDLYKIQNRAAPAAGFYLIEFTFENFIESVEIYSLYFKK